MKEEIKEETNQVIRATLNLIKESLAHFDKNKLVPTPGEIESLARTVSILSNTERLP